MKIRAASGFNLIDYPGKIAAMVFAPGCNYKCPACHAKPLLNEDALVDEEEFFKYLDSVRQWVNGVVICGGEPTMQDGLLPFLRRLKAARLPVKLDTNGSAPEVLTALLAENLADYVAMDVKGPRNLWPNIAGTPDSAEAMLESMRAAARFPDHEFRTTIVPVVRSGGDGQADSGYHRKRRPQIFHTEIRAQKERPAGRAAGEFSRNAAGTAGRDEEGGFGLPAQVRNKRIT